MNPPNIWLMGAAGGSFLAAAIHLAVIAGGAEWFRVLGAGERVARAAERGSPIPTLAAIGIAAMLAIWGAYALSGAGMIRRLPLLRAVLVAITAVLAGRVAIALLPGWRPDLSIAFRTWSSLAVLVLAMLFAAGTIKAWPHLARKEIH